MQFVFFPKNSTIFARLDIYFLRMHKLLIFVCVDGIVRCKKEKKMVLINHFECITQL